MPGTDIYRKNPFTGCEISSEYSRREVFLWVTLFWKMRFFTFVIKELQSWMTARQSGAFVRQSRIRMTKKRHSSSWWQKVKLVWSSLGWFLWRSLSDQNLARSASSLPSTNEGKMGHSASMAHKSTSDVTQYTSATKALSLFSLCWENGSQTVTITSFSSLLEPNYAALGFYYLMTSESFANKTSADSNSWFLALCN